MRNISWAIFVKERRKARGLTRRKLAEMAEIDPSYVTLIERDGYVPRKDKVEMIAQALEADLDQTLLTAGYAPQQMPVGMLIDKLETVKTQTDLVPELKRTIHELFELDEEQQKQASLYLKSFISVIKKGEGAYSSGSARKGKSIRA